MPKWTKHIDREISWGENPHKEGTDVYVKFEKAKGAKTVGEAKAKSASAWELAEWHKKGRLKQEGGDDEGSEDEEMNGSVARRVDDIEVRKVVSARTQEQPTSSETQSHERLTLAGNGWARR